LFPSKLYKNKPPNSHDRLNVFLICGKPLLKAPNYEFRAFKEWNLGASGGFPPNQIKISMNDE